MRNSRDLVRALWAYARRWEAPTWALIVLIYGSWLGLTAFWHHMPLLFAAPCLAWICAWQMSLQHEAIHGHPTRWEGLNAALAFPPLTLWLPYPLYRISHRQHHNDDTLTDPFEDPESTYMSAGAWAVAGAMRRFCHRAMNTMSGRLLLGPLMAAMTLWRREARLAGTKQARPAIWVGHGVAIGLIMAWVCGVCRIDLLTYGLCGPYAGTMLSMIRSLAEHRAAQRPQDRTAVVEKAGLLGLLFLHNNLHVLHHAQPGLPWFDLPAVWRRERERLLLGRNGPVYHGYGEVAARYLLRPHHPGPHPEPGGMLGNALSEL